MAERRMFAKTVIDTDLFIEMPLSAQALYFHLGMHANDSGEINNIKAICRAVQISETNIDILLRKGFLERSDFVDSEYYILHWEINNDL